MALDLSKLLGVKIVGNKRIAGCPACAAVGADSSHEHLAIYSDGRYGCCVDNSPEHSKAIWRLAGDGKAGSSESTPVETQPQIELPRIYPPSILDGLVKDYTYWKGRGISEATLEPFRGGVATRGQMKDRFVFPQFNSHGDIIGFSGRCLLNISDEDRKKYGRKRWKHLSPVTQFLWGGLDEIDMSRRAILVESIGDGLALIENGVVDVQCLFGVNISQAVIGSLVAANPRQIIVSTNHDVKHTVGQNAAIKVKNCLDKFFNPETVSILHPESKDWGESTPEQIYAAFNQSSTSSSED